MDLTFGSAIGSSFKLRRSRKSGRPKFRNQIREKPLLLQFPAKQDQRTMTERPRRHLIELLKGFSTAMMITSSGDRSIHARPMAIAEIGADGELYFATSLDSGKLRDIEANPDVALIMQNGSVYVSLQGTANLSTDPALIARLWSEAWKVWFPEGKDDPSLVIMKIDPIDAEYWDNSGMQGVGYAMTALKAYIKGETPSETDAAQHAKVKL
jgi:general stress protein 26